MFGRDNSKRGTTRLPDINFSRYQQVKNINSRFSGTGGSKQLNFKNVSSEQQPCKEEVKKEAQVEEDWNF